MHNMQRQVDVRTTHDVTAKPQGQPLFHRRTYHQQSRYVLAAHVARYRQNATFKAVPIDMEWGITLFVGILYVGTQRPQRVDKYTDRTMAHALSTRYRVLARRNAQVGGHKPHGCSRCLYVDSRRHVTKGINYDLSVVAVGQVLWQFLSARQGMKNKRTIADTLRCRKINCCIYMAWSLYLVCHDFTQMLLLAN